MRMEIGDFLNKRLKQLGIFHVFGVPGDFNLSYLEQIQADTQLEFIGNCNELNAAYAADGYARIQRFSALVTTYGVGDLSAINAIAGAYAEHVPVVHISGIPPLHAVQSGELIHHTLVDGNYDNIMHCMQEFTVAQTRLTPANAVSEIDRVLRQCILERRPVYLQLPSDITHLKIEVNVPELDLNHPHSDSEQLQAVVEKIAQKWSKAQRPVLLIDQEAQVFQVTALLKTLAERCSIPFVCLPTSKNIMDESSVSYAGVYVGAASHPQTREIVENSDCLIGIGVRFTDVATGLFSHQIDFQNYIEIRQSFVGVGKQNFSGIEIQQLLTELNHCLTKKQVTWSKPQQSAARLNIIQPEQKLSQATLWNRMMPFFQADDVILGEVGTSNSALSGLSLPATATYISQPIWGSIGYTLPALLGTLLAAPERRQILFIGDGSLQLTVQELSTIVRHGLKPIIFVLNNGGYTIERLILGEHAAYNDIQNWKYTKILDVFNAEQRYHNFSVETVGQLETVLQHVANLDELTLIELKLPALDAPASLHKFADAVARYDYGDLAYQKLKKVSPDFKSQVIVSV